MLGDFAGIFLLALIAMVLFYLLERTRRIAAEQQRDHHLQNTIKLMERLQDNDGESWKYGPKEEEG